MTQQGYMDESHLKEVCERCNACETCLSVCCTFEATGEEEKSPMHRLGIISRLLSREGLTSEDTYNLYTCTDCGRCDTVCPMDIPISAALAQGKVFMVERGAGPLPRHEEMIASIFANRNAVNKDPETRLDWLPEEERSQAPIDQPCDTLLYLGCMASYLDMATARASYFLLKKAGIPFTLMGDEFCCGIYPYNAGKREEARMIFEKMHAQFKNLGISRILVPCAGCHRTFSFYYKEMLRDFAIEVRHISEIMLEIFEEKRLTFTPASGTLTFHDSCKLGRKAGIYDAPRTLLRSLGFDLKEMADSREDSRCCGAGAGVRSFAPDLSMSIGKKLLEASTEKAMVSTCPFCIFNLGYTAKKSGMERKVSHIAPLVYALVTESPASP